MAFCIQCGNQIKDGAKFCPKCGTKQDNEIPNSPENIDNNDDEELYDVYIKEVDDARKMEVLRELCAVGGYDLAEAGDIVENSGYIKEGVPKEEAEQLKKKFELLGAVVEIDEFVTGKRRESVITSFPQFVQKFGAAIGMWTIGWVLQLTDYDKDLAVQKANTVNGIENLSTLFPALLLGISIIGLIFYPVTKERFQKLTVQLEKKRNGEDYNTEGFEKLL